MMMDILQGYIGPGRIMKMGMIRSAMPDRERERESALILSFSMCVYTAGLQLVSLSRARACVRAVSKYPEER